MFHTANFLPGSWGVRARKCVHHAPNQFVRRRKRLIIWALSGPSPHDGFELQATARHALKACMPMRAAACFSLATVPLLLIVAGCQICDLNDWTVRPRRCIIRHRRPSSPLGPFHRSLSSPHLLLQPLVLEFLVADISLPYYVLHFNFASFAQLERV